MEENLFRMYDTNMDGVISMEEFLIVYHIFSEGTPEENLTKEIRQQFSAVQSILREERRKMSSVSTFDLNSLKLSVVSRPSLLFKNPLNPPPRSLSLSLFLSTSGQINARYILTSHLLNITIFSFAK